MIKSIGLKNYRNLQDFFSNIQEKGNYIIASNGRGKTNILESIYYSIFGKSFRNIGSFSEIIGPQDNYTKTILQSDTFVLELILGKSKNNTTQKKLLFNNKKIYVNKVKRIFPVILFAPNSVDLISGEPSARRSDLNDFLTIYSETYEKALENYQNLIKKKNFLLKNSSPKNRHIIRILNEKLCDSGTILVKEREAFFSKLTPFILEAGEQFSVLTKGVYPVTVKYLPNIAIKNFKEEFSNLLEKNLEKELLVGKTLYGPHKDDFEINIKNGSLRFLGSRGQQRLGAFLIKIAQINYLKNNLNLYPLFLIDDLMSELDKTNREAVGKYLQNLQINFILTSAEKNEIPENIRKTSSEILIP